MSEPVSSPVRPAAYVDRLSIPVLLVLALRARRTRRIWFFEPPTAFAAKALRLLDGLRILRATMAPVPAHVGQIRDETGGSRYPALAEEIQDLCEAISRSYLKSHPLILGLRTIWNPRLVVFHFEKVIEEEVRVHYLRLALVRWVCATMNGLPAEVTVVIPHTKWLPYLYPSVRDHGLRILTYWRAPDLKDSVRKILRGLRGAGPTASSLLRRRGAAPRRESLDRAGIGGGSIAVQYGHTGLSFDPTERSEFFWLFDTAIPSESVVLYNYAGPDIDAETARMLKERGIRVLGRGPGVLSWRPTLRTFQVLARSLMHVATHALRCWARGQRPDGYSLRILAALAVAYAYWVDFFSALGVRIHVGTIGTSVGQILALETLRGVGVAYQYSASNIIFPTKLLSGGEHVHFVFSQPFARLWEQIQAPTDKVLVSGFVYDRFLHSFRGLERVAHVRRALQDRGAQFVLCFFDENSVDRWDVPASNEEAADDYAFLLRWLLDDPTLGIVFKPKKLSNLFHRIASVRALVEEAGRTGRIIFLGDPTPARRVFPAEAAAVADLCVGKLSGTTAALEAFLAGIPTLVIDTEGLRSHPMYGRGRGQVLFEGWTALRSAIEQFRRSPRSMDGLGDWSSWIQEYDPYRDRAAGQRIGLFVQWVRDGLLEGASPAGAIAAAARRYEDRWQHGPQDDDQIATRLRTMRA